MFGVTDKPKDEASNVWKDIHENSLERGGGFSFFDDYGEADFSGRRAECDEKCGENASCINGKCHCLNGFVGNGMFCIRNDFGRMDETTETPATVIGNGFHASLVALGTVICRDKTLYSRRFCQKGVLFPFSMVISSRSK